MMSHSERILFIQPYGIGDALFMLPLLKALKGQKKIERIDCILGSRTSQILENSGCVDEIFVIDKDKWREQGKLRTMLEKWRLLLKLGRRKYTIFIDFSMQPEYSFWAKFVLRIPLRAGFNYKGRNRFLTLPLHLPPEGFSKKHVIEYYGDLGRLLGVQVPQDKLELHVTADRLSKVRVLLASKGITSERYAVVSPGGGVTWGRHAHFKHWPIEHFAGLLRLLKEKIGFEGVVVLGIPEEYPLGERLKGTIDAKIANLCGQTDLMDAAAVIKMSCLFLGNDGGLVHLAASQNAPIIALYGPTDHNVYGVYPELPHFVRLTKDLACQPCYENFRYKEDCKNFACLRDFTPQEAFEGLKKKGFFK